MLITALFSPLVILFVEELMQITGCSLHARVQDLRRGSDVPWSCLSLALSVTCPSTRCQ